MLLGEGKGIYYMVLLRLWRTESTNCYSRKYMYYYMSRRETFPDLFSSFSFTSAQRIKSCRILQAYNLVSLKILVITHTVC